MAERRRDKTWDEINDTSYKDYYEATAPGKTDVPAGRFCR